MTRPEHEPNGPDAENEERRKAMVDQINQADKAYLRSVIEWEKVKTHLSELFNRSRALFSTDQEQMEWAKEPRSRSEHPFKSTRRRN